MKTPQEHNKPIRLQVNSVSQPRKPRSPKGQARPYRDDGRWKHRVYFDDANGNRIFAMGTGSTAKAAQDKAKRNLEKKKQALAISEIPPHLLTCEAYFKYWLETVKKPHISNKTFIGYQTALAKHLIPFVGPWRLQSLERKHIQNLFDQIASKGLSRTSQVQLKAVIQPALEEAHLNGYIQSNPFIRIKLLKKKSKLPKAFDLKTVEEILKAAVTHGLHLRWHIGFFYGLRQGEAIGLRWSDLELTGPTPEMKISQQLQRQTGRGLVLVPLKTNGSIRTLPLTDMTVELLKAEQANQALAQTVHGPNWNREGFIFVTPQGTPIDASNERNTWKKLLKQAGVDYMPLHTARKSAASMNQNPAIAQRLLGHATSTTTLNYYIDVPQEEMRSSLQKNQTQLNN